MRCCRKGAVQQQPAVCCLPKNFYLVVQSIWWPPHHHKQQQPAQNTKQIIFFQCDFVFGCRVVSCDFVVFLKQTTASVFLLSICGVLFGYVKKIALNFDILRQNLCCILHAPCSPRSLKRKKHGCAIIEFPV